MKSVESSCKLPFVSISPTTSAMLISTADTPQSPLTQDSHLPLHKLRKPHLLCALVVKHLGYVLCDKLQPLLGVARYVELLCYPERDLEVLSHRARVHHEGEISTASCAHPTQGGTAKLGVALYAPNLLPRKLP